MVSNICPSMRSTLGFPTPFIRTRNNHSESYNGSSVRKDPSDSKGCFREIVYDPTDETAPLLDWAWKPPPPPQEVSILSPQQQQLEADRRNLVLHWCRPLWPDTMFWCCVFFVCDVVSLCFAGMAIHCLLVLGDPTPAEVKQSLTPNRPHGISMGTSHFTTYAVVLMGSCGAFAWLCVRNDQLFHANASAEKTMQQKQKQHPTRLLFADNEGVIDLCRNKICNFDSTPQTTSDGQDSVFLSNDEEDGGKKQAADEIDLSEIASCRKLTWP